MDKLMQIQDKMPFNPFSEPEIERVVYTTQSQLEIWTDCILGGDDASRAYNLSISIKLKGHLIINALEHAVNVLTQRHECLRACFSKDGRFMSIFSNTDIVISHEDISHLTATKKEQTKKHLIKEDINYLFDLVNGPLFKVRLIKVEDFEYILVLTHHHIIGDGLSIDIMVEELGVLYSSYVQNKAPNLPKPERFSEYAEKIHSLFDSNAYKHLEAFWLNMYKESVPTLELPIDYPRPSLRTYDSNRLDFPLEENLINSLKKLGISAGCSLVTTLLSAFEIFLCQLTGQNDLVVGFPSSGNAAYNMKQLIGDCVNLLPLRSHVNTQLSFIDYLKQRNTQLFDAYEHQQVSFSHLLQKLAIARDPARIPLVPVILTVDLNKDIESEFSFIGLSHEFEINPRDYVTFELQLHAFRSKKGPSFQWSYNTKLFKPDTIKQMMSAFEELLENLIANPSDSISSILNKNLSVEYDIINQTKRPYPHSALHELILAKASETDISHRDAILFNGASISYATLFEQVNQLSHYFLDLGIKNGDVIGVSLPRCQELPIVLLSIMQCGAIYLPLDPTYPQSRLEFMLVDSEAKLLITNKDISGSFPKETIKIHLDEVLKSIDDYPSTRLDSKVSDTSASYILYTSGSTGKPKGVAVTHKNLVNFLYSMADKPGIDKTDKLLSITTISFDIAGLELFLPLLAGATLVIADDTTARDGRLLHEMLIKEHISILQATPTTWQMLLDSGWNNPLPLKALCGGEALPLNLAQELTLKCDSLWNMYGPTETTIWSSVKLIDKNEQVITIGKPIANTLIYILNEQGQLVPPGSIGEITIGGDGVALGYLNRPELNSEKFIQNPFNSNPHSKLYKTGDLGKLLPTGEIQCLGRADQQVKIRGHRIELGEIEQALSLLDDIHTAVVLADSDTLTAYVIPNKNLNKDVAITKINEWKDALKTELPPHLVPNTFHLLDSLPTTLNGKIDRKALLEIKQSTSGPTLIYTGPRTKAEEIVSEIWQVCLGLEKVDIFSNFFELGGHSLIAVKAMRLLEEKTGKHLPLSALFEYSTVEKLAELLEMDSESISWDSLVAIKSKGTKTPLYIIHGAGLNVLKFIDLSKHLDDDQPVFGIQGTGLNQNNEPYNSIEEIAEHYISSITKKNPNGPYALAGYSFGGIIAFEMAKQLINQGKKVSVLAMLDSYVYPHYYYKSTLRKKIESSIYQINWRLFDLKLIIKNRNYLKDRINGKKERLFQFYFNRIRKNNNINNPEYIPDNFKVTEMVRNKYQLIPLPLEIDLFRAKSQAHYMHDTMYLGWKNIALKGINIHEIHGNHAEIFSPPFDKEAALILQEVLDERNLKFGN